MKNTFRFFLIVIATSASVFAEDKSVVVNNGAGTITPDFEIVSGREELSGDPTPSPKESHEKWKKECSDWKTEFKNNNKENHVISLSCGSAKMNVDASGLKFYKSEATYKIKTKIRK